MNIKVLMFIQKLLMPILSVLVRLAPNKFFPITHWDAPRGPYPVGVRDTQFVDDSRVDADADGQKRKLMARVWYPAHSVEGLERRRMYSDAECPTMQAGLKSAVGLTSFMVRRQGETLTWSYENAPLIECEAGSLPVLIFSHGFSGTVGQNTHLCERLASQGYLVISVAHTYSAAAVHFPDGSQAILASKIKNAFQGPKLLNSSMAVLKAETPADRKAARIDWSSAECVIELNKVWVDDTRVCLDKISQGECQPAVDDLAAAGDFSRVGAFGMSFGGSCSASVAQVDERIVAAINLDGGQADNQLLNTQIRVPLLMLHSSTMPLNGGGGFNDYYYEPHKNAGVSGRVSRADIEEASHMDFTDLALLGGPVRALMGLGSIDGHRMLNATADACQDFFDAHIKRQGDCSSEVVLNELVKKWPEIKPLDMSKVRELEVA